MKALRQPRNASSPQAAVASLMDSQSVLKDLEKDTRGFLLLSELLKRIAGINLPSNGKNHSLMASRLLSILRDRGHPDYSSYYSELTEAGPAASTALTEFISALTTNTTHFFRESAHFDLLRQLVPQMIERKRRQANREIRVWCSAASTGQEPYTILMTLLESLGADASRFDLKFLASDIDPEVLRRASLGIYSANEAQGVPDTLRSKYFEPSGALDPRRRHEAHFQVRDTYRRMIRFAQVNLLDPLPFKHQFDIIFCRNVLIYFDRETTLGVVDRMTRSLAADGYLFLGHSESGGMRLTNLKALASAAYQKPSTS